MSLAAVSVLWMILQFVINIVFSIWEGMRGDGPVWLLVMKDGMSPAIAAYRAFAILGKFRERTQWRLLFIGFVLTLTAMTFWGTAGVAEFYRQTNQISRWHEILFGSIAGVIAGTIGAAIFVFRHPSFDTPGERVEDLSSKEITRRMDEIDAKRREL
jgi:hypothetical protein